MPARKQPQKQRSQQSLTGEAASRQHVLSIQEGADIFGTCAIETFPHEAPKACEIFAQFCVPSVGTSEKNRGKQAVARTILFKRLSSIGVQFGESGTLNPKIVPAVELDGEVGSVAQEIGTLSLCRSGDSLDGGNFFICMTADPAEQKHLAGRYVSFGRVAGGLDVIKSVCEKLTGFCGVDGVIDNTTCPLQIADVFPSS